MLFKPCTQLLSAPVSEWPDRAVHFSFFFLSPCTSLGRGISPVKLALSNTAAEPGSLASRAEQCHSRGFFSIFYFERSTEQIQRADVLCYAKTGTGTGEWAMESECDDTCVLHPSCVPTIQPTLLGCHVSEDFNLCSPLGLYVRLKGDSGTLHVIKHGCDSPDGVEQPIVATCIPFRVTVAIRGTAWMEVRFGPIPVYRHPKGGVEPWSVTAVAPVSHESLRSVVVVFRWRCVNRESVTSLSHPFFLYVARPWIDIGSANVSSLAADRLTASQWLKDTENHRSSAATYRQYSRLMSGTMSSSRQTTSRRTGRTIPRTPSTSYTCDTRRFPSKTRRHYYNE